MNEITGEEVLIVEGRSYRRLVVRGEDNPGELGEGVQGETIEGGQGAEREGQLEEGALH